MALVASLVAGMTLVGGASVTAQRLAGVADNAAISAADAASGALIGAPCERAAQLASASRAQVVVCGVEGLVVTVEVEGSYLGIPVRSRARAGPPSDQ